MLTDFHAKRLEILISTSPDYLALETMPDTFEVEVLLDLLTDCPIPFWVSYSCKEGNQTNAGQSFQSAVDLAQGAMAVGINCTKPELIGDLLRSARSDKPYVVYPNSGRVWDAKNKVWSGSAAVGFSNELVVCCRGICCRAFLLARPDGLATGLWLQLYASIPPLFGQVATGRRMFLF